MSRFQRLRKKHLEEQNTDDSFSQMFSFLLSIQLSSNDQGNWIVDIYSAQPCLVKKLQVNRPCPESQYLKYLFKLEGKQTRELKCTLVNDWPFHQ